MTRQSSSEVTRQSSSEVIRPETLFTLRIISRTLWDLQLDWYEADKSYRYGWEVVDRTNFRASLTFSVQVDGKVHDNYTGQLLGYISNPRMPLMMRRWCNQRGVSIRTHASESDSQEFDTLTVKVNSQVFQYIGDLLTWDTARQLIVQMRNWEHDQRAINNPAFDMEYFHHTSKENVWEAQ